MEEGEGNEQPATNPATPRPADIRKNSRLNTLMEMGRAIMRDPEERSVEQSTA